MTSEHGGTRPLARTLAWVVLAVMAVALVYTASIAPRGYAGLPRRDLRPPALVEVLRTLVST